MVPRIGRQGRSFKGAGVYYLHDKDARTSDRVAWTLTLNLPTDDPARGLDWMACTALDAQDLKRMSGAARTGRASEKPVWTLSLAWHPEQDPTQEHMVETARSALEMLGLKDHQALIVSHNDTEHRHVHIIVNLVHPETGRTARLPYTKERLSKWAQNYEREHGKIYCDKRVENNEKRDRERDKDGDKDYPRYKDPELEQKALITKLYNSADSGKAFQAALAEHGFTLAQGKRIVIIDQEGTTFSLSRQIEGVKTREIRERLGDLVLPTVDEARSAQQQGGSGGRQEQEKRGDEREAEREEERRETSLADSVRLNRIQDRQLEEMGRFYDESTTARWRLEDELETAYGAHERRLRRDIADRENALANAGRLRLFFMRLTGRLASTRQEIQNNTRTLENLVWRKQERIGALEKQIEENRTMILVRHQQERNLGIALPAERAPSPAAFHARRSRNPLHDLEHIAASERRRPAPERVEDQVAIPAAPREFDPGRSISYAESGIVAPGISPRQDFAAAAGTPYPASAYMQPPAHTPQPQQPSVQDPGYEERREAFMEQQAVMREAETEGPSHSHEASLSQ